MSLFLVFYRKVTTGIVQEVIILSTKYSENLQFSSNFKLTQLNRCYIQFQLNFVGKYIQRERDNSVSILAVTE